MNRFLLMISNAEENVESKTVSRRGVAATDGKAFDAKSRRARRKARERLKECARNLARPRFLIRENRPDPSHPRSISVAPCGIEAATPQIATRIHPGRRESVGSRAGAIHRSCGGVELADKLPFRQRRDIGCLRLPAAATSCRDAASSTGRSPCCSLAPSAARWSSDWLSCW